MLLDDYKSGGFVYVNKDTYDQALLLSGRMDANPQRVLDVIKTPKTEIYRTMAGFKALMENMMNTMPKPLNMLAPFLILCVGNQGIDWKEDDRVFAYGVLHQLSQLIDFNNATLVPAQIRADVALPTALLMQYKTSWDELCSSLEDKIVSVTPQDEETEEITKADIMDAFNKVMSAITKLEDMNKQTPQIVYAQQPIVQPVVQPSAPIQTSAQPVITQPVVESKPVTQPVDGEKKVEVATSVTSEPEQKVSEAESVKVEAVSNGTTEQSEDDKKADAVAAIIARMSAERANKDKEKKEKLEKLTSSESEKPADTTGSFHTDKKYTEEERQEINGVLDEYAF